MLLYAVVRLSFLLSIISIFPMQVSLRCLALCTQQAQCDSTSICVPGTWLHKQAYGWLFCLPAVSALTYGETPMQMWPLRQALCKLLFGRELHGAPPLCRNAPQSCLSGLYSACWWSVV